MVNREDYNLGAFNVYNLEKECRFQLERSWDHTKPKCGIIMFNPREINPNPFILGQTLGRIARLVSKECGSISVVNLFSKTSKSKKDLDKACKIFDEENFTFITETVVSSTIVVLFWGDGGSKVSKNDRFIRLLQENEEKLWCFGVTKKKQPRYERNLGESNTLYKCTVDKYGNIKIVEQD